MLPAGADLQDAFEVRRQVFQVEQGIDTARDFDGQDEAADQMVAYLDEQPVGTARIRYLDNGDAKIERMAVLRANRGKTYGLVIMQHIFDHLRSKGVAVVSLESQLSAAPFYEKLGFQKEGAVFEEVGIPHIKMTMKL